MDNGNAIVPVRDNQGEFSVSRRSFIEVAVGTIVGLPIVSGGLALPFIAKEAHALDTQVVIAKLDEVAVVVMDMAGNKRVPLEGAHVKLTSNFNGKSVEANTDKQGKVVINIADLAEEAGKKARPARYEFQAQVEITKNGYRTFRTGRMLMQGARGIAAPTRKLEAGVPYPSCVTFDDWDALYTENEFCVTPKNDMRHEMRVDLENLAGTGAVKVMLYANEKEIASTTATPSNGRCTASLLEQFLMTKAERVLPVGANYSIRYSQDGQTYAVPISLKTMAAAGGFEAPGVNRNFGLSPFSEAKAGGTSHKGLSITIPNGCPLLGGQKLQLWKPEFTNLDFGFDPFGFAYISFKTSDYGFKEKDGKVEGKAWQAHPKKSFSEQYEKVFSDAGENALNTLNAIDKRTGKFTNVDLTHSFSATVMAQISLVAKWGDKQEGLFRVRAGGQAILSLDFSLAWQFLLGPVPLIFQFSLNASFALGISIAASTTKLFEWSEYQLDYTNSALSFTIDISPSISLGVGIKGALSVSVKGSLTVTIFMARTILPDNRPKDVENPHQVVGISAGTFVVIQFLFFTIPFALPFKINEPAYYDNWKGGYKKDYAPKGVPAPRVSTQDEKAQDEETQDDSSYVAQMDVSFEQLLLEGLDSGDAYILQDSDFEAYLEHEYGDNGVYSFEAEAEEQGKDEWAVETGYSVDSKDYNCAAPEGYDDNGGALMLSEIEASSSTSVELGYFTEDDVSAPSTGGVTGQGEGGLSLMAATSPDLTGGGMSTQSAPPKLPALRVAEERAYLNKGDSVVEMKVAGLASRTGLTPKATEIFSVNSLGDPRIKTHSIFGREFIFRIGAMKVARSGAEKRTVTRILCEGSFEDKRRNYVFDFDARGLNVNRNHLFDYDYDFIVQEEDGVANLYFFVVSGKRTMGQTQSGIGYLGYLASEQIMTYAHYQLDASSKVLTYVTSKSMRTQQQLLADTKGKFHYISCPQIQYITDTVREDREDITRSAFVMSYLDRASDNPDKLFSQNGNEVSIGFGMFFYDPVLRRVNFCSTSDINDTVFGEHKDFSVFEVNLFDRYKSDTRRGVGWHVAMIKGGSYTYYFLVETGACGAYRMGSQSYIAGSVRKPRLFAVYDPDQEKASEIADFNFFGPARLVAWPKHEGCYLASVKGRLMRVTLENFARPKEQQEICRVPQPHFVFEECGPKNFSVQAFGVDDNGRFLYYPAVREGVPGYTYDKDGNGTAKKEVEEHDVMACKLYGDTFSDPFVFCEVDYDMDTLVALSPQKSIAMSFLSTNLTDTKKSKAEIRYTAMPYVRCANVIGFSAVGEYSFPGVASPFNVTIRNDGNVHLAGCTIRLRKQGAAQSKTDTLAKLVFSQETLVESNFNPPKDDGTLEDVLPNYELAPGKTSVYQIDLVIPDNWNGRTNASVTAEAFIAAEGSGGASGQSLSVQSIEALDADSAAEVQLDGLVSQEYDENGNVYVDYIVDESDYEDDELEYPYDEIDVWYTDEVDGVELDDAPIEGQGDIADDDGKGNASTKATPAKVQATPKLGDQLGGLNGLFMATAAAGAAMTAYSARRVANERAAAKEAHGDAIDDDLASDGE